MPHESTRFLVLFVAQVHTLRQTRSMTPDTVSEPHRTSAWEIVAPLLLLSGVAAVGVGAYLTLHLLNVATGDISDEAIRSWVLDFTTSPAAAGLAAVLAAIIGATAVLIQLAHSRSVERDKTWWESFQWVTDRGLQPVSDAGSLPPGVALDTLTALLGAARGEVQKAACKGIVDHLAQVQQRTEANATATTPSVDSETRQQAFADALERWNDVAAVKGVAPTFTPGYVYEREIFDALGRLLRAGRLKELSRLARQAGASAQVLLPDGRRVRVEAALRRPPRLMLQQMNERGVQHGVPTVIAHPRATTVEAREPALVTVNWDSPDDDIALAEALLTAANVSSSAPSSK